jgi:Flp pilus assembly protein TadD
MAVSAIRKASLAALLMLGAATVPAHAGWFDLGSNAKTEAKPAGKANAKEAAQAGTTLEDSIQEARMLRLAGSYPEAIKNLSQLMMVASDDPHVISEYGKTLASMGRASDAVNFLTRAQQLEPGDWTIYSALGVAYDQIGDQKSAQTNYEQALKIKPEEPSVLSNYALSRMLAKDPDMARKLAVRAETAGGIRDAVIGRNITMIRSLAPETPAPQVAQAPAPAPHIPAPVASNVQPPVTPVAKSENRVVMQKVPVDPLAGPVRAPKPVNAEVASTAPRPLQPKPAEAPVAAPVKTAEAKPIQPAPLAKTATPAPVKTAEVKPTSAAPVTATATAPAPLKAAAAKPVQPALLAKTMTPAPVKTAEVKPASTAPVTATAPAPVKAAAAKPVQPALLAKTATPAPLKSAEVKPASATPATSNATVPMPVKAAEVKPAPANAPAPVKSAEAKPVQPTLLAKTATPAPVKTADAKPAAATPVTANATAPVKSADAKPVQPAPLAKTATPALVKAAEVKPAPAAPATAKATAPVKAAEADKPAASVSMKLAAPVKAAEAAKPEAPKVLASAPVKAADGKPVVKAVGQSKDAIPGLRLSANAY